MPPAPLTSRFGNFAGRTVGSRSLVVVVGLEIDGVLVDVVEQRLRDLGQAGFGVAHRGRRIAVDRAEIALPVDQRHAHGEILRHAHQRVVDRLVAVRMVFTDDVADGARRLVVRLVPLEPVLVHRVENAPMHRLEAVARIRQAPAPRSRSWRNRGRSVSSRRGWKRDEYRRAPAALRACVSSGSDKGGIRSVFAQNHIAYRGPSKPPLNWSSAFSRRFSRDFVVASEARLTNRSAGRGAGRREPSAETRA